MTIKYNNGPGNSIKTAISIIGAKTEWLGVDAEYRLISMLYAIAGLDYDVMLQGLLENKNKYYDKLSVKDSQGNVANFYFDISEFYNHW